MLFHLVRLSLLRRTEPDLLERRGADGQELSREEWLREIFSKQWEFDYRRQRRVYVPEKFEYSRGVIVARIGRELQSAENSPPDGGLADIQRPQWKAALVFIDCRAHDDGQRVAIEKRMQIVQDPVAVWRALVDTINLQHDPEPYVIEVSPISDPRSFWDYVKENEGQVTSVTLDAIVPNMAGGASSYEEDMKALRERERARRVKETIINDDGLNVDTDRMREAVDYAAKGGGTIKAKSKNSAPFHSNQAQKTLSVEVEKKASFSDRLWAALRAFVEP